MNWVVKVKYGEKVWRFVKHYQDAILNGESRVVGGIRRNGCYVENVGIMFDEIICSNGSVVTVIDSLYNEGWEIMEVDGV